MSGGHFDYKQYEIGHIADEIEQLILENEYGYSEDTLGTFKNAVECLKASQILAQRNDYLEYRVMTVRKHSIKDWLQNLKNCLNEED